VGYVELGLLFLLFLLALVPTRKLWIGGIGVGPRTTYLIALLAIGALAVQARPLAKYLLPAAILLYLLPFTGLPERWARWRTRASRDGGAPGARNVGGTDTGGRVGRGFRRGRPTVVEGHAVRLEPDDPPPS